MSGLLQGLVLGLALLHNPVGSRDRGTECTLSKCASDSELPGAIHTPEGRNSIQRDLDRLEKGVCVNLMEVGTAKCQVLQTEVQAGQQMD